MYLNILIVPILAVSIILIYFLRVIRKHDKLLFKFCQIRRELMAILRAEGFDLSQADYYSLRKVLKVLNTIIHNYSAFKREKFNLRWWLAYLKELKGSTIQFEQLNISNNSKIAELQKRLYGTILQSFFAYTPFIKSEMLLLINIHLLKCLAKLGISIIKRSLNFLQFIEDLAEKNRALLSCS